jgi:Skp family chaperone for outer membrane proteins
MTRVITATVLSTFLVAGAATAQTPAAPAAPAPAAPAAQAPAAPAQVPFPADAKIGFVNLQGILLNSALGRAGQEKLKALTDKQNADIGAKTKELQTLQQEIQSGQNVLAPAVLTQKTRDAEQRQRELQLLQEQARSDFEALQSDLLDDFGAKVLPIIEQVRAERNLWVIFAPNEGTVAAMHNGLDLSAEVVRRLDATK